MCRGVAVTYHECSALHLYSYLRQWLPISITRRIPKADSSPLRLSSFAGQAARLQRGTGYQTPVADTMQRHRRYEVPEDIDDGHLSVFAGGRSLGNGGIRSHVLHHHVCLLQHIPCLPDLHAPSPLLSLPSWRREPDLHRRPTLA